MFSIVQNFLQIPPESKSRVFLIPDDWDDWFAFQTAYAVIVHDSSGKRHRLGEVKIGEEGLRGRRFGGDKELGYRTPTLPESFNSLSENHFSLGQDDNYYETLNALDDDFGRKILLALRDCAFDLRIFAKYEHEQVMQASLLRFLRAENVRNRLNRLANGNPELTRFEFEYVLPDGNLDHIFPEEKIEGLTSPTLSFVVEPNSEPPTNVHVLIGRNGVGKTRCIQSLIRSVLGLEARKDAPVGELRRVGANKENWSFAGLVLVSFSIFDDFEMPAFDKSPIRPNLIGLRESLSDEKQQGPQIKTAAMLTKDFTDSFGLCRSGLRAKRWRDAIKTLEVDSLFAEAGVAQLLDLSDEQWEGVAIKLFKRLSSGHAIVLLTTTRLVELVDERTLVILDEPEGHLHPPLLSAFIRSVADLMVKRNGVAIIATHSPVVLQEVPRLCAWKLKRTGLAAGAERPQIETFGENVGVLTREVFGLEVTESGFHNLIRNAVKENNTYDEVIEHFGGQVGMEARAIARNLVASMKRDGG